MKTGTFRKSLMDAFEEAKNGNLDPEAARNMIGFANAINNNFAHETKLRGLQRQMKEPVTATGETEIYSLQEVPAKKAVNE